MSPKDRKRLYRVYQAIQNLPAVNGKPTLHKINDRTTVREAIRYSLDQVRITKLLSKILAEFFHPDSNTENEDQKIDNALINLEKFISKRKSEGWGYEGAGSI